MCHILKSKEYIDPHKRSYVKRVTPMGIPNTRLDDLPDLIDVQKKSFEWFLKEGLKRRIISFFSCKRLHRKIGAALLA